jgi:hypothetical protein
MAYVIAEPCLGVKDASCVDACSVQFSGHNTNMNADSNRKRNLVDRFTLEMLESYCAALGIEVFEARFLRGTMSGFAYKENDIAERLAL